MLYQNQKELITVRKKEVFKNIFARFSIKRGFRSAGPNAFFRCAGTIITERTIVTAAHCLTNEKGTC